VLAPGTGITVGQRVPDGRVLDLEGKPAALSSIYAKVPSCSCSIETGGARTATSRSAN